MLDCELITPVIEQERRSACRSLCTTSLTEQSSVEVLQLLFSFGTTMNSIRFHSCHTRARRCYPPPPLPQTPLAISHHSPVTEHFPNIHTDRWLSIQPSVHGRPIQFFFYHSREGRRCFFAGAVRPCGL